MWCNNRLNNLNIFYMFCTFIKFDSQLIVSRNIDILDILDIFAIETSWSYKSKDRRRRSISAFEQHDCKYFTDVTKQQFHTRYQLEETGTYSQYRIQQTLSKVHLTINCELKKLILTFQIETQYPKKPYLIYLICCYILLIQW